MVRLASAVGSVTRRWTRRAAAAASGKRERVRMSSTTAAFVPPQAAPKLAAGARLREVDLLRGLVIVLMALDHTRDYFHISGYALNPLDPAQTTPLLYVTRWITHFCAPTFVLLAGVSAFLQEARGKPKRQLSLLLLTRGLWLIVLELTVISYGWAMGFPYPLFLQVIWATGWAMIVLAGLVWLPRMAVLATGIAIIAGHNLLDGVQAPAEWATLWQLLHVQSLLMAGATPIGLIAYPIAPWIGFIALGYGMGALFTAPARERDRTFMLLGAGMIAAFFLLRTVNGYGDLRPWADQPTWGGDAMAYMDVTKYPPSLDYALITLGPMFLLFPLLSRLPRTPANVLAVFGAAPFFFYVLHIYLIHALAIAANAAAGHENWTSMFNYLLNAFTRPASMDGLGFPLPVTYAAWITVLAILYRPCRWFAGVKQRRRDWWLSYL